MGCWRYLLACMVIVSHTPHYFKFMQIDVGNIAVITFFFISGHLMPLAYQSHYQKFNFIEGVKRFYINRILRIFPIYWISCLILLLFLMIGCFLHPERSVDSGFLKISTYFQNFLLLGLNQSILWGGYTRINNPAWSLDVELQYYVIVPLLLFLLNKKKVVTSIFVAILSILSIYLLYHPAGLVDVDRSLITWSIFFFLGFIFQVAIVYALNTTALKKYCQLISLMLLFLSVWVRNPILASWLLTSSFIIFSASLLMADENSKYSKFDSFLGDLSYPVYIMHFIFLGVTIKIVSTVNRLKDGSFESYAVSCISNIMITTFFAYIVTKLVSERIELIRKKIRTNSRVL